MVLWRYLWLWAQHCLHLLLLLWVYRRWLDQVVPHHSWLAHSWLAYELWVYLIITERRLLVLWLLLHDWLWHLLGLLAVDKLNELSDRIVLRQVSRGLSSLRDHLRRFGPWISIRSSWPLLWMFNHFLLWSSLLDINRLGLILRLLLLLLGWRLRWLLVWAIVGSTHRFWALAGFNLTSSCRLVHRYGAACDLPLWTWLDSEVSLAFLVVEALH